MLFLNVCLLWRDFLFLNLGVNEKKSSLPRGRFLAPLEYCVCNARIVRGVLLSHFSAADIFLFSPQTVALQIVSYVESHAADADIRGATRRGLQADTDSSGEYIVDAGFILTAPLNRFLAENRNWNDALAFINSIVLILPAVYAAKVTLWNGDYTLAFRIIATHLFRSFCGWFTFLPPPKDFLMSLYDFPEVAHCFFQDCSAVMLQQEEVLPFVTFFSGHVATCVICANHLYLNGHVKSSLALHAFNVFQMIRLLATRGHYSIDIIIGWCVAVNVSNPAGRAGRSFSRGVSFVEMVPATPVDAFETVTGVQRTESYNSIIQSDTTARIAAEVASNFAKRGLQELRTDLTE